MIKGLISIKDKNGKTGLDYAKQNGKTDIVKLVESFQMKIEDGKKKFEEKGKLQEEWKKTPKNFNF